MNEADRRVLLSLSWFPPDREILGVPCRSLSLASHHFVKTMGIRSLDPHAGMSRSEEIAELSAYVWLHTADPATIAAVAWSGDWQESMTYEEESEAITLEILHEWREIRERVLGLLAVSDFDIRPRPKSKHDKTPSDVIGVSRFAHQVATLAEATGWDRDFILWELPKWEADQLYHKTLRHEGAWTVRAFEKSAPDDFAAFEMPTFDEDEPEGAPDE